MSDRITARNVTEVFLKMEEEEDLFGRRAGDGTYYWDIVRRDVFVSVYGIHGGWFAASAPPPQPSFVSAAKNLVKAVLNRLTRRYVVGRAPKYIFLTGQRMRRGSRLFDPITDHLCDLVGEDAIAVELMNKAAISYADIVRGT